MVKFGCSSRDRVGGEGQGGQLETGARAARQCLGVRQPSAAFGCGTEATIPELARLQRRPRAGDLQSPCGARVVRGCHELLWLTGGGCKPPARGLGAEKRQRAGALQNLADSGAR